MSGERQRKGGASRSRQPAPPEDRPGSPPSPPGHLRGVAGAREAGEPELAVVEATERAIAAADHLTDADAGAIETLRYLARKIDTEAELREMALRWAREHNERPPAVDNVSIPTYLKFCEALGLTPSGRLKFEKKGDAGGGKLASLRQAQQRPKRTA